MTKTVTLVVNIPDTEAAEEQINEWLTFELAGWNVLKLSNPLSQHGDPEVLEINID